MVGWDQALVRDRWTGNLSTGGWVDCRNRLVFVKLGFYVIF